MFIGIWKGAVITLVTVLLVTMSLLPAARAAVIGTDTYLTAQTPTAKEQLQTVLDRDDVRARLVSLGVDPDLARARVAALTPAEALQLQNRIDALPAGAGALEVIGIVFLILLILELTGITNIFHKI